MYGNRRVLGPEIVAERLSRITEQNVWFFVKEVNKQLITNPIRKDGSIDIIAYFKFEGEFLTKLIDIYLNAGWDRATIKYIAETDGYPEHTIVTLYPYPEQSTE